MKMTQTMSSANSFSFASACDRWWSTASQRAYMMVISIRLACKMCKKVGVHMCVNRPSNMMTSSAERTSLTNESMDSTAITCNIKLITPYKSIKANSSTAQKSTHANLKAAAALCKYVSWTGFSVGTRRTWVSTGSQCFMQVQSLCPRWTHSGFPPAWSSLQRWFSYAGFVQFLTEHTERYLIRRM